MPQPNKYTQCAAPGCARRPRPFSRFCEPHYDTLRRTRDLNGRVLTKGELRGHRQLAREFIERNAEHPAVIAALAVMADLVEPKEGAGFLRREFARLRAAGAEPSEMLASVIAVYSWAEWSTEQLPDKTFWLNLGRAVLNTVPAAKRTSRNGKTYYTRTRGNHAEALGRHLRDTVGLLGLVAAQQIRKDLEAPQAARGAIRKALETVPFNPMEDDESRDDERE